MSIIIIVIQLYIIIFVGYLLDRFLKLDNKILSNIGIYILAPALVFYGVYTGEYNFSFITIPLLYVLLNLLILLLSYFYAKIFKFSFEDQSIISVISWAGNNGNFGIPVILFLLGESALAMTSLLVFVNAAFISGPGAYFLGREKGSFKKSIIKVLKLPLFYALILGLIMNFTKIHLPDIILNPTKIVGEALIPMQLILLGTFLARIKITKIKWSLVAPSLIFKLIIMPFLAYGLVRLFSLSLERDTYVLLIEAATPIAVMSVALADIYGRNPKQVALANFLSMLLVPFTLSLFWYFINI